MVSTEKSSDKEHAQTSLGSYRGQPFVVGSFAPDLKYTEVFEIFNSDAGWTLLADFPFVRKYISDYSIVDVGADIYIFGGYGDDQNMNKVCNG